MTARPPQPTGPADDRPFRLWPYLLACAAVAAWVDLGGVHRLQSCDSVVFTLASLYEWTPFFWEQDRVGMLLPLLTSVVRDPFANLLVHTGVLVFCGLALPLLLARLVCPHRLAPVAVTAGNAAMLALAPDIIHENMLVVCYYPFALVLGLSAFALLDGGRGWAGWLARLAAAWGLLLLAHWVYAGACVFLGPLAVGRAWLRVGAGRPAAGPRWAVPLRPLTDRRCVGAVLGVGLSVGVVYSVMGVYRAAHPEIPETPPTGLPIEDWPPSAWAFWQSLERQPGFEVWFPVVVWPMAVGLALGLVLDRRAVVATTRQALPLVLAAATELTFLSTRAWPALNLHHPRYLLAIVTAAWTALALVGLVPVLGRLARGPREAAGVGAGAIVLLLAAATIRYGFPSPAGVRGELDRQFGGATETVLEIGCDGVGGEYMNAWPQVLHANMALHDRGENRVVVGVSFRSAPWVHRWRTGPLRDGFRLVAPAEQDATTRRWIAHYELEVTTPPEPHGRMTVYTVRPVPGGFP